jgi:TPR repeat protein
LIKILTLIFISSIFSKDLSVLTADCNKGNANSCFEAAYEYSKSGDQIRPIHFFEKACELKDGKSCFALDRVLKKLKQDNGSDEYIDKACEFNFPKACFKIFTKHFEKKKFLESMIFLKKSCAPNEEMACAKLDELNEYFSRVVRSSEKELNKEEIEDQKIYLKELNSRITLRISKCEAKDYDSCTKVARDYLFLANVKQARKWAEISCLNSRALGCLTLGEVEQKEAKKELPSFEKACELKSAIGCFRFAQSIEQSNLAKAMSFYRKACESENSPIASACKMYSEYNSKNEIVSKKFLDLACKIDVNICKK